MTEVPLIDHPRMKMPALGFGTFQLDGDTVLRMIPEVLDMGYRHVDTAQAYDNEAEVGKALEQADVARSEVFVTTKVWVDRFEPDDLRASLSESLDRLRSDYVDLLLLHWPVFGEAGMGPTLEALMREREDGRARHIGVSNFTIDHLEQAVGIAGDGVLATNQVEYHVYLGQHRLHEAMRRLGLALTAYMPLAKGEVADDPAAEGEHGRLPVDAEAERPGGHLSTPRVVGPPGDPFDDAERAQQWLRQPHALLGGESPLEHMDTYAGTEEVRSMLYHIEYSMPV